MTTASRVPRSAPLPSPQPWFPAGLGLSAGWTGIQANASYYNGHTYVGFCDGDGAARVASYDHATRRWTVSPAIVTGLGADIHCTPSVLIRSGDHKILIAVAPHNTAHMYVAVSTNAEDVTAWGAATDIASTLGGSTYTYANLFQLSGESGKIYLFYRDQQDANTSATLCYSTSTDGGATWTAQTSLYKNTGKESYWVIASDDASRIDFIASDGSASAGDTSSVYHFYYSGGSFFKSDGTTISVSKPFAPSNLTKIYDGATNGHVTFPSSVLVNGGNPVATWDAYNSAGSGSNVNYWYGSCSSGVWTINQITDAGATPDSNFSEGGCVIDTTNPSRVFVSKKTSSVWQMFKYVTANGGSSWTSTQLTTDSSGQSFDLNNLRPRSPRNAAGALTALWCFGPHWAFNSAEPPAARIRAHPNPVSVF